MKITRVEPIHLRLPEVNERCDGSQETLVVKVHTDGGVTGLGLVAAGASMGPLLPTLLGKAVRLFPQAPGSACGAVLAAGTAGGLILSPLIAWITAPWRP